MTNFVVWIYDDESERRREFIQIEFEIECEFHFPKTYTYRGNVEMAFIYLQVGRESVDNKKKRLFSEYVITSHPCCVQLE